MSRHVHEQDPPSEAEQANLDAEESQLRVELGDNQTWVDEFKLGLDMEEFENSPAGNYLAQSCLDALQDAFAIFLESSDLSEKEAIKAHKDAQIALGMLELLKDAVARGKDAEERIRNRHEPQDE